MKIILQKIENSRQIKVDIIDYGCSKYKYDNYILLKRDVKLKLKNEYLKTIN